MPINPLTMQIKPLISGHGNVRSHTPGVARNAGLRSARPVVVAATNKSAGAGNPLDFLVNVLRPRKSDTSNASGTRPEPGSSVAQEDRDTVLADVLGRSTVAIPRAFDARQWDACLPKRVRRSAAELLFAIEDPASAVRAAILADPVMGSDALNRARMLQERQFDNAVDVLGRFLHVPFMGAARQTYVTALNEIMLARSQALHAALAADPAGSLSKWDAVVVGAGPHGLTVAQRLQQAGRSVLIIEANDGFSTNFREAGQCFRLNSANRADDQSPAALGSGKGNINPLPGPVQVPDISTDNWPMASAISEAGTINLYASQVPVLFATVFKKVVPQATKFKTFRPSKAPRYSVSLFDREADADREISTENVVVATGLGTARAPVKELQGRLLAETDTSQPPADVRGRMLNRDPGIRSVGQAFRLAAQQKDPLKPYREPWALIGFGDSAKTFLQYVYGLTGSYPATVAAAQQGTVVGAQWYVGDRGPDSCKKYLEQTRGRYADLVAVLRKPKVNLVPARVAQVQSTRDGYAIFDENGRRQNVRRVVFATGFEDESRRLATDLARRPEDAPGSKDIEEYTAKVRFPAPEPVTSRSKKSLPAPKGETVGRNFLLAGAGVYLAGPAAGRGIVPTNRTAGVAENVASLANLIPRTQALGDLLAEQIPARYAPELPRAQALSVSTESEKNSMQIPLSIDLDARVLPANAQLTLKALLTHALSTVKVQGRPLALRFSAQNDQLQLRVNTSSEEMQALHARFAGMPGFYESLGRLLNAQRSPLLVELGQSGRVTLRTQE